MDNDTLAERVRAGAIAGWVAVIVGAVWLTVGWLIYLIFLRTEPGWVLTLWGGRDLTWENVQWVMIIFLGVGKLILFTAVLLSIWATVFAAKLKRGGGVS